MWCIAAATGIMDCSNRMGSEYDERLKAAIVYEFFAGMRHRGLMLACGQTRWICDRHAAWPLALVAASGSRAAPSIAGDRKRSPGGKRRQKRFFS